MSIILGGWSKVDPAKEQHLGHIFEKDGKRAHDKRCDYCGTWMTYDVKNIAMWFENIKMGLNGWPEKVHCGSSHCIEYHRRVQAHEVKVRAEAARVLEIRMQKLALALKDRKLVS